MFTLNELEIGFLKVLDIDAKPDEFFDEVNKEPFKLTETKKGPGASTGGVSYIYTCGSNTIIIDINENSVNGVRKSITVIKDDMKYVFNSVQRDCFDSIRVGVTIGDKKLYHLTNETISLCFTPFDKYDNDEKKFLTVSLKSSNYCEIEKASVSCTQSCVTIRRYDDDKPIFRNDILTSEKYQEDLDMLIGFIRNTTIRDEFVLFTKFFQSIAPLSLINREIRKVNANYDKSVKDSDDKFQQKLARNANANRGVIREINGRRINNANKINDERKIILGKYDEIMRVFNPKLQIIGMHTRVYRTDIFE